MSDERASTYHRPRLILRTILLALLALPLLYLAAAVAGALMPRNPGWEEPPQGVLVFVRDNGVHVDLVLPASAAGFDLYRLVSPAHIADPESARGWVAFGWGHSAGGDCIPENDDWLMSAFHPLRTFARASAPLNPVQGSRQLSFAQKVRRVLSR